MGLPLLVRLPIAVLLVAVAARLNQPRLVPVACAVGIIGLYGAGTFITVAMGALSPRLARARVEAPTPGRGPERLVAATTASPAGEAPPAPS